MTESTIVSKVWNFASVLRDDGVSYGDYLEQITYLLFLKIADELNNTLHYSKMQRLKKLKVKNVVIGQRFPASVGQNLRFSTTKCYVAYLLKKAFWAKSSPSLKTKSKIQPSCSKSLT